MNIKGERYETQTEQDAIEWITRQSGREMKRCVFPTRPCLNYYISRDGVMYGCKHFVHAKKFVAYKCNPKEGRKAQSVLYSIFTPDGESCKIAARLIWCTWVLGYWSDKVKVRFKDGNRYHIDLSNLAELNNEWKIREEQAKNMQRFEAIYRREFRRIARDVHYTIGILEDEAKDAVQDAYIAITRDIKFDGEYFIERWVRMSQKIAIGYIQHKETFRPIDCIQSERETCRWDNYNASTILIPIKDDKERMILELVAQGVTGTDIAKELGISRSNVVQRLRHARGICKAYLKSDRELMKIYNKSRRDGGACESTN